MGTIVFVIPDGVLTMSNPIQSSFRLRVHQLEDRLTPTAGMLDPTFGVGGLVSTRFPCLSDDYARAVAIDSQDRIIVAGNTGDQAHSDFAIARYMPSGALDTSFGGTGVVTIS